MRKAILMRSVVVMAVMVAASVAQGATIYGLSADAEVRSDGSVNSTGIAFWAGFSGTTGAAGVVVFALPDLDDGYEFTSANFRIRMDAKTGTPTYNGDVYGLGYRISSTVLSTDFYMGSLDTTDATLIQNNFVVPSASSGTKNTDDTGDAAVLGYLNAQLAASATDRANGETAYIFFRVNPDVAANSYTRYIFDTRESDTNSYYWPQLEYTFDAVPEPATMGLLAVGGLALVRRRRVV